MQNLLIGCTLLLDGEPRLIVGMGVQAEVTHYHVITKKGEVRFIKDFGSCEVTADKIQTVQEFLQVKV